MFAPGYPVAESRQFFRPGKAHYVIAMKTGKKLTYVSLPDDESIHAGYERALDEALPELGKSHPLHIGGSEIFIQPVFEVRSPFDTRILVGRFQTAPPVLIRSAIMTAKDAFPAWRAQPWNDRVKILRKAASVIEKNRFPLAAIITYESGKTRAEAIAEVSEAVDMIRYHAAVYTKNKGFIVPMVPESPGMLNTSVMQPYGTRAVISPFNFPLSLATGMAAGALITGNTVILKPTSEAPFSCLKLYEAFIAGGVPADAVHYLTGPGGSFGDVITAHPEIDGIAFTGSRYVGIWLERSFAERQPYQKPVIAEMGSKNPVIVTANADLTKAVEGIVRAAFGYSGQKCSATSRVYVDETVAGPFLDVLRVRTEALAIGDPRNRSTFMGPVIDKRAVDVFRDSMIRTLRDGGTIVTGGKVLEGDDLSRGYFVEPTIVTGIRRGHPLTKRELFVPYLIVEPVRSL